MALLVIVLTYCSGFGFLEIGVVQVNILPLHVILQPIDNPVALGGRAKAVKLHQI